ncbi:MAG TPA: hypothetical protein VGK74_27840 [Symbiobacteriaceae bacterium]|jgi:hypothetical protein
MVSKEALLEQFKLFAGGTGGIANWLQETTPDSVIERLTTLDERPLSHAQLNQILLLSHEAGCSEGFFQYYWGMAPNHPYDVRALPRYRTEWNNSAAILSLDHLWWGIYRLYVDSLLYFGDVQSTYRTLHEKTTTDLQRFFAGYRFHPDAMKNRGPILPMAKISMDDRYLISEMACKSYGGTESFLERVLLEALSDHHIRGGGPVYIRDLIDGNYIKTRHRDRHVQLTFAADEVLDAIVESKAQLEERLSALERRFEAAHSSALKNTRYYLSLVNDLDVYVATSMRSRQDFRTMATMCQTVFGSPRLQPLFLRYFDPTLSATEGHEDKGLVECLMVKCAKVLLYSAGARDSYGKDAEAAMALSLGKPVIFFCDEEQRRVFYRDVHPLSRLIAFDTGVVVGAMVTSSEDEVVELLHRLFENKMEYTLEQPRPGYLRLREKLSGSVVRLQTNDSLIRETFQNYYHQGNRALSGV